MLIAISGSQGSGKSTTLAAIKERGYNTIERKTSRSILEEWDVTLQEVNNNPKLTIKFQNEITKRKYADELSAAMSDELWFTERTHSDLFTYALVSLGKYNQYSDWLNEMVHNKVLNIVDMPDLNFRLNSIFWSAQGLVKNKIKTIGD